jgi:transposase
LWLDFEAGSRFACPECGEWSPVHDTVERQWRHLNFWQHETFLIARVPRTKCDKYFVAGHFKVHHLGALISTSKCTTSAAFF